MTHQSAGLTLVFAIVFAFFRTAADHQKAGGKRGATLFWTAGYNAVLALPIGMLLLPLSEMFHLNEPTRLVLAGLGGWQGLVPTMNQLQRLIEPLVKGELSKHGISLDKHADPQNDSDDLADSLLPGASVAPQPDSEQADQ